MGAGIYSNPIGAAAGILAGAWKERLDMESNQKFTRLGMRPIHDASWADFRFTVLGSLTPGFGVFLNWSIEVMNNV